MKPYIIFSVAIVSHSQVLIQDKYVRIDTRNTIK